MTFGFRVLLSASWAREAYLHAPSSTDRASTPNSTTLTLKDLSIYNTQVLKTAFSTIYTYQNKKQPLESFVTLLISKVSKINLTGVKTANLTLQSRHTR